MLSFRQTDNETIELVGQIDLAREARVVAYLWHEVEHVLFGRRARSHSAGPFRINIDVAGRAGTITPAVSIDARHAVVRGGAHESRALGHFDRVCLACEPYERDFGHARPYMSAMAEKRGMSGRHYTVPVSDHKHRAFLNKQAGLIS
jgi:hypothetical protein